MNNTIQTDFPHLDTDTAASHDRGESPETPAASGESNGNEANGDQAAERPSEHPPELRVARPAAAKPEKSKSQRIREVLAKRPEVRNRDVVDALGEFGVTPADVSNVRMQLRKKAEKQQRTKARTEADVAPRAAMPRTQAPSRAKSTGATGAAAAAAGEIAMTEIEAGLSFIEQAGGIERARQVIELIARIREISLKV